MSPGGIEHCSTELHTHGHQIAVVSRLVDVQQLGSQALQRNIHARKECDRIKGILRIVTGFRNRLRATWESEPDARLIQRLSVATTPRTATPGRRAANVRFCRARPSATLTGRRHGVRADIDAAQLASPVATQCKTRAMACSITLSSRPRAAGLIVESSTPASLLS
jgi:hypothetical protein